MPFRRIVLAGRSDVKSVAGCISSKCYVLYVLLCAVCKKKMVMTRGSIFFCWHFTFAASGALRECAVFSNLAYATLSRLCRGAPVKQSANSLFITLLRGDNAYDAQASLAWWTKTSKSRLHLSSHIEFRRHNDLADFVPDGAC